jgi:hypothetical protein
MIHISEPRRRLTKPGEQSPGHLHDEGPLVGKGYLVAEGEDVRKRWKNRGPQRNDRIESGWVWTRDIIIGSFDGQHP